MAGSAAPAARGPVNLTIIELLHHEFVSYLLKHHDDGRFASEDLFAKLEQAGYSVGRRFAERLALQRERARPHEVMDVIKWVCRDFWIELYQKQIDKLQTNNRGVFVLQDFNFRWQRFVSAPAGEDTKHMALKYLVFPCGLIRGALAACDVDAHVSADLSAPPRVVFHMCVQACGAPTVLCATCLPVPLPAHFTPPATPPLRPHQTRAVNSRARNSRSPVMPAAGSGHAPLCASPLRVPSHRRLTALPAPSARASAPRTRRWVPLLPSHAAAHAMCGAHGPPLSP